MTLLYTVERSEGWMAAIITIMVMIGFPAIAGVYVSRLRREGEHLAADALLGCTLGTVVSMFLIWGIGGI